MSGEAAQPAPCPGSDPFCPCQDGDACHYRNTTRPDGGIVSAFPLPSQFQLAAAALVRKLAEITDPYEETARLPWCFFCHAEQRALHATACLWRRAKELVG